VSRASRSQTAVRNCTRDEGGLRRLRALLHRNDPSLSSDGPARRRLTPAPGTGSEGPETIGHNRPLLSRQQAAETAHPAFKPRKRPQIGGIRQRPGNGGSHKTAWWARKDSNLKPDRYGWVPGGGWPQINEVPSCATCSSQPCSVWLLELAIFVELLARLKRSELLNRSSAGSKSAAHLPGSRGWSPCEPRRPRRKAEA
jgi:hypothetical protein